MKYGLTKIILIDSYLPSQIYKVEVDGQINILGENKLGKTSLIKLAVIFYGTLPKNIGIKPDIETKQKSFAEYYLPRTSSYIIFEYLTEGKPRMLVMTSSFDTKDQFIRTFVKSGFKEEDFWHEESDIPIVSSEWLKEIAGKYHTENCRGADAQNKMLLYGKNANFSMVPYRHNLTRLREIMTSAFSRNSFSTDINGVINDWICNDLGQDFLERADASSIRKEELDNWVDNFYCLKQFEEAKPQFETLSECLINHNITDTQVKSLYQTAKVKSSKIKAEIKQKEEAFEEKKIKLNDELTKKNDERRQASTEKTVCENKYNELCAKEKHLHSALTVYKNAVPKDLFKLETENEYTIAKIDDLTLSIKELTEKHIEAERFKEKSLASVKAHFKDQQNAIELQKANEKNQKTEAISNFNRNLDEKAKCEKSKIEENKKQLEKQHFEANSLTNLLKGRLISPSLDTSEYETQKSLQRQLKDCLSKIKEKEKSAEKIERQQRQLKAEQQSISIEINEKSASLKDFEQELQDINSVINAEDGSLLSFLKREVPDWQETHGRVLKRDILNLKGLEPKRIDGGNLNTLFGVEISTNKLPLGEFEVYDEKVLNEKQQRLFETIENLNNEIDKLDNKYIRLNKEAERSDKAFCIEENLLKKAKKQHEQLTQDTENENNLLLEKLDNLKKQLEQELKQTQKEVTNIKKQINDCDNSLLEYEHEIKTKKEKFEENANASLKKTLVDLDQKLNNAKQEQINNETSINVQFNNMLKNGGVDFSYLRQLEKEREEFKIQNKKFIDAKNLEQAYINYKNNTYLPEIQELEKQKPKADEEKKAAIENLEILTSVCLELKKQQEEIEDAFILLIRSLNLDLTKLQQSILSTANYPCVSVSPLSDSDYTVQRLCESFDRERKSLKEIEIQIEVLKKQLLTLFEQPGTYSFYYMKEEGTNSQDGIMMAKRICDYLTEGFYKINYGSFIQSSEFLRRVDLFIHSLRLYKQKIKSYNRGLNKYMEKTTGFYGIDNLEVEIVFQHTEREDWALIEDINRHYKVWNESRNDGIFNSGETNLPSQELVSAVESYKNSHNPENMSVDEFYKYIDFSVKVVDSGVPKNVKSLLKIMSDKSAVSSRGASYLILISIFIGIVNMMRQNNEVHIAWALDELADISPQNITNLLRILKENNINMISACTVVDQTVFYCFDKNYSIEADLQTNQIVLIEQDVSQHLSFLDSIFDDEMHTETLGEIHA